MGCKESEVRILSPRPLTFFLEKKKVSKEKPVFPIQGLWVQALLLLVIFVLFHPPTVSSAPLDPESVRCIRCHETYVDPDRPGLACHSDGCNHPVGLDYVALAAKNPGYTAPEKLNPAMKFPGGIMGCTTCHRPYSADDHELLAKKRDPMLAVDNTASGLCMQCHIK